MRLHNTSRCLRPFFVRAQVLTYEAAEMRAELAVPAKPDHATSHELQADLSTYSQLDNFDNCEPYPQGVFI